MKSRPFFCISAVLFILVSPLYVSAQRNTVFPVSETLANKQVSSIAQGEYGTVWFGTKKGLSRYNGSYFINYFAFEDSTTLFNDNIRSLMADSQGRLFIATERNLADYSKGRFHNSPIGTNSRLSHLVDMDQDFLLACDSRGIVKIDKTSLLPVKTLYKENLPYANAFAVNSLKQVWVVHNDPVLPAILILDEDLNQLYSIPLPKGTNARSMIITGNGEEETVWISQNNDRGIVAYLAKSRTPVEIPKPILSLSRSGKVLLLKPYHHKTILLGINGRGLFECSLSDGECKRVFPDEKLQDLRYTSLVDSSGNLWLSGSDGGFSRYNAVSGTYDLCNLFSIDSNVTDMEVDPSGKLWIGTTFKRIICVDLQEETAGFSEEVPGCLDFGFTGNGQLWRVRNFSILQELDIIDGIPHLVKEIDLSGNIYSFCDDSLTKKLIAVLPDKLMFVDKESGDALPQYFTEGVFNSVDNNSENHQAFLYAENGDVYELTGEGTLLRKLDLPVSSINTVYIDEDGLMWVGTSNSGLYCIAPDNNIIQHLDQNDGLPDNSILSIISDLNGNIFFAMPSAIASFSKKTFEIAFPDIGNKSVSYLTHKALRTPDGSILFAGNGGITMIPRAADRRSGTSKKIPVLLDAIAIGNNVNYNIEPPFVLPFKDNTISFYYGAVDFASESSPFYETMLEGFDKDWIMAGSSFRASYSNLPGGNYVFRVKLLNSSSPNNASELAVPFRVKPAPWKTFWAYLLYALIVLLAVSYAYMASLNRKLRRERVMIMDTVLSPSSSNNAPGEPDEEQVSFIERERKDFEQKRDSEYIARVQAIIEKNIPNEDFNVSMLADEMCTSYSRLYSRVKEITGESPKVMIDRYRMNYAMQLLKTHKYTVNEVSYMVGISAPSNFSRSFKQYFGLPPGKV